MTVAARTPSAPLKADMTGPSVVFVGSCGVEPDPRLIHRIPSPPWTCSRTGLMALPEILDRVSVHLFSVYFGNFNQFVETKFVIMILGF